MRTAKEYTEKLYKMRKNLYLDGELIGRDDPRLRGGINVICETFNYAADPQYQDLMNATSHLTGKQINRYTHTHRSVEDLLRKQEMTRFLCQRVGGCIQRCMGIDALNALSVVTKDMDIALGTRPIPRE